MASLRRSLLAKKNCALPFHLPFSVRTVFSEYTLKKCFPLSESLKILTMAAADVSMILRDFWKMWLKGFDAEIDCQQIAQSLFEWTQLFVENQAPLARPTKKQEYFPSGEDAEYVV